MSLDLDHLASHADVLGALAGPEKVRLALLTHGKHSLRKAVRHGLMLARDHAGRLAHDERLTQAARDHFQGLDALMKSAPPHIAGVVDRLIELGPEGHDGQVFRDVIDSHRDAAGGSFWKKAWRGIKKGASFVAKHVLEPLGRETVKLVSNAAKNEVAKAEKDPLGTAAKLGLLAA